jgi:hypothetical protein
MARYLFSDSSTVEICFNDLRRSRIVNAETADVVIMQWNGIEYVETGTTITADTSQEVITRGLKLQFVMTAGAVNIEEGVFA